MNTEEIKQLVINKANGAGINPNIALAQIERESGFNPNAVGGLGERGLGQFTAATWQQYGSGSFDNAFDPDANLTAWGHYMADLMAEFLDYEKALQAYNGGPGHLRNPGKYGPPSAAARAYAQAIVSRAGFGPGSIVNLDSIEVAPPAGGIPLWVWLAAGTVLLIFVLKD